jgi:hypothetical protein
LHRGRKISPFGRNDRNTPNQSVTNHGNFEAEDCW